MNINFAGIGVLLRELLGHTSLIHFHLEVQHNQSLHLAPETKKPPPLIEQQGLPFVVDSRNSADRARCAGCGQLQVFKQERASTLQGSEELAGDASLSDCL